MELKLNPDIRAAVQINNETIVNLDNSLVYESIDYNEAYIFIRSADGKEIKIRFVKKLEEVPKEESKVEEVKEEVKEETKTE